MPVVIFGMGCVADSVLNAAMHNAQAEHVLPQLCGMVVGMLTVLTFAMRRQAYLAAGVAFIFVEMVAVMLDLALLPRIGLCASSLVTAVACLVIYLRGPWETRAPAYARERDERP